ncbi:DNA methyltransferase [Phormidium sp. CLA17]|uniref:DNA methyltransferase n=1 Tax=Leptolyngbya sp. Cla-17 TaxID=2803751 RepID=UPI0014917E67|nr:DNA methyltransferase [Leptolyngbya sp. Cla-17]MBM0744050.1 DNA methyltransferase [Leptolyngbya sp. Cla-17]
MHKATFNLETNLPNLVDPLEQIPDFSLLHLNQLKDCDRAAHDWYRFVLSFPPHLVQDYLERFGINADQRVLDPFCGTGTTVVDAKKLGIASVGVEANPMAHFAGSVKLDWNPKPDELIHQAERIAERAIREIERSEDWRSLPEDGTKIILKNSISPLPLHKALILKEQILAEKSGYQRHFLLAFARAIVTDISNLRFGPEVGVSSKLKSDVPVVEAWLARVAAMAADLRYLQTLPNAPATIHHADARQLVQVLEPNSIDAVITSPPYPNEKDYTRTTRLESVLLGFLNNKAELRALKQGLMRSNTRNVYKADLDDQWVSRHAEIQRIAQEIEDRRLELGKTSGFERLYHRAAKHYFGGMAKHLADLRWALRPNAQLAYVVGDQKSYLQVMIRTGELLADIAQGLGYEVVRIDLFRTRLATALKEQIREEVVVLRWSGKMPTTSYPFSDRPL